MGIREYHRKKWRFLERIHYKWRFLPGKSPFFPGESGEIHGHLRRVHRVAPLEWPMVSEVGQTVAGAPGAPLSTGDVDRINPQRLHKVSDIFICFIPSGYLT